MSTWPRTPPLNSNGSGPPAPPFNLIIWLPPFKTLCLILTCRRGIIHCPTVDTVMGMGVNDMQHTMASPRQSQTLGTDIHLPFRDQFDKWQQTSKGLAPSSPSLATDTKRLATDKQLVWQQTIRLRVLKSTLVPRPPPST